MQIRSFAWFRLGFAWPPVVLANEPAQNRWQQSSATCFLIPALKTTPAFGLTGLFQQLFNEARCFEFVEGFDGLAKAILCQRFDLGLFQLVLLYDLEDEVPLFTGAVPVTILGRLVLVVPVAVAATLTIAVAAVCPPDLEYKRRRSRVCLDRPLNIEDGRLSSPNMKGVTGEAYYLALVGPHCLLVSPQGILAVVLSRP